VANFGRGGAADLAIGAPGFLPVMKLGTVNVIYGSSSGLSAPGNRLWSQDSPRIGGASQAGDEYGLSLT
jgi:hypothetical protein